MFTDRRTMPQFAFCNRKHFRADVVFMLPSCYYEQNILKLKYLQTSPLKGHKNWQRVRFTGLFKVSQ